MDLNNFLLDGKFCALNKEESKSIIHQEAVNRHRNLLCEYITDDLSEFILPLQEVPLEEYVLASPPRSFLSLIRSIIDSPSPKPNPPPFKFDTNEESLQFNSKVLSNFRHDLSKLIPSFKNNTISLGSEFRDLMLLDSLLNSHKYLKLLTEICTYGVFIPFKPIKEEQRLADLEIAIL